MGRDFPLQVKFSTCKSEPAAITGEMTDKTIQKETKQNKVLKWLPANLTGVNQWRSMENIGSGSLEKAEICYFEQDEKPETKIGGGSR